jgi:hypothetical protein
MTSVICVKVKEFRWLKARLCNPASVHWSIKFFEIIFENNDFWVFQFEISMATFIWVRLNFVGKCFTTNFCDWTLILKYCIVFPSNRVVFTFGYQFISSISNKRVVSFFQYSYVKNYKSNIKYTFIQANLESEKNNL